ncbi:pilus assembly protein [Mesorhizobium sp. Root157]|uniref:TadE/TadG family type IV pilus assembly protein n=1 Tax=Mesorhizobium sp. Root157 TaxID=1736477 RepID=UPI002A4E1653|nr:pilus assembly protein [Mesorhizobium sp. Root157]
MGRSVARFWADRRGNFAVIFGMIVAVLALAVGFGVDTAQLMNAKSALRNAVDAAVTSTARELTVRPATEEEARKWVAAFLTANSAGGILPHDDIVLDKLVVDKTAKTVTASAYVDVALYFPLFGQSNVKRIHNMGAAVYSDKHIEVAMMLDLTTSMEEDRRARTNKIGDLKVAAAAAVSTFLDMNNANTPRIRVALVPYSDGVNTGPLAHTVFREAKGSTGKDDAPPSLNAPQAVSVSDNCATERKNSTGGGMDYSDAGPSMALVNRDDRIETCPVAPLVPLTTDEDALLKAIDQFKADGYTAGHIGVQWTRYLLSPSWRSVLESAVPGSGPLEYTDNKAKKIAILMTDGAFNTAFAGVSSSEKTRSNQKTRSQNAARELCSRMKQDGIEIFTIGFMLAAGDQDVMSNCASPDTSGIKHYFLAADGAALKTAFQEIARNTERLALTQ